MWQCSACRHQTTLLSGTIFEATKLPLRTWFLALYLLTQSKTNVAALELMRHLGVCYRTAWRIKHKLMQAMTEREAGRQLGGLVQIDDAYLGGERNGGKPGRGSENKCPFVIAVELSAESHPLHAVITPVAGFTTQALTDWTRLHLRPETEVHSDGLGAFRAVIEAGHAHTVIESEGGRAATEAGGMRWVNTVLSNVKRSLDGTYHAFRFAAYAHRYLAEAAWRFNRRFDLKILVPRLLVAAARCKAWPERRLRAMPATPAG
ncbi:ISXo5 transposase [mine drainage metagenome]|uniref:ISXo5 transposase n=1 Tax=mine drainage metagenome TaxID=410659 RepID=T1AI43_9ZZZZ